MKNFTVSGTTDDHTHICADEGHGNQEWKINCANFIEDDSKFPYIELTIFIGTRWGGHETIDWTFEADHSSEGEIAKTIESFKNFRDAVNRGYDALVDAAEDAKKFAQQ